MHELKIQAWSPNPLQHSPKVHKDAAIHGLVVTPSLMMEDRFSRMLYTNLLSSHRVGPGLFVQGPVRIKCELTLVLLPFHFLMHAPNSMVKFGSGLNENWWVPQWSLPCFFMPLFKLFLHMIGSTQVERSHCSSQGNSQEAVPGQQVESS
jgi:hypothetical protein